MTADERPPTVGAGQSEPPTVTKDRAIEEAQDRLAKALGEARGSEDRELARMVRELGEHMARVLHGLLKLCLLHDPNNRAFDGPVSEFSKALDQLIHSLGPAHMTCVENQVYVNDLRLRFDTDPQHAEFLGTAFRQHNVGGLTFNEPLSEDQVRSFVGIMVSEPGRTRPRTRLQRQLAAADLATVELHPLYRFQSEEELQDKDLGQICRTAARQIAELIANIGARRLPNPLPIRRVVHDLIDIGRNRDGAALAFAAERAVPDFARHILMVTNLSLLIGRSAGLSDVTLADLGMAAVYHDVGLYVKEGDGKPDFAMHPYAGLGILIRERGFHPARVRRILTLLEHHRELNHRIKPSLFARIVHIADDFDILTRDRPGKGPLLAPPYAIRMMASESWKLYDPVLFQAFVNTVGAFPPGTMLRMDDARSVESISGVRTPETFARPLCRVTQLADGRSPAKEIVVDLAREGRIKKVIRPIKIPTIRR